MSASPGAADEDTLAGALASFAARTTWDDLPDTIRHEAKRSLLNFFGTALGGWIDPAVEQLHDLLTSVSGPAEASVIGCSAKLDVLGASFLNAVSANVLDFDDTHMPTIIHPSAPVAPPLLALAERTRMPGRDLLAAFAVGVDVACRLGASVSPGHYARGWHITTTCGVIGAAAASAKALGVGRDGIAHAIGIAACGSAGLVENLPNGAKNVQVGNAARNGLFAALAAERGITAAPFTLEGTGGWGAAFGVQPDRAVLLGGLGQRWELARNAYKASPCGIVLAPVIDAALMLRSEHGVLAGTVAKVSVRGSPLLLARANRPAVPDDRIAKLSIQHSVAVALLLGAAGVPEFSDAAIRRPDVADLRSRVDAEADPDLRAEEAYVTAYLNDGQHIEVHVPHARGSLEKPLSDAEIEDKLRELARLGAPGLDPAPLIDAVWALDRSDDAGAIMRHARPN
ncbi:MmgE/PrpD family protein [uncultured Enterovirga sp.]|uniref:MmgE/PrpD family protein n=1 Tax=uncultured Enterovirga sp. TaxID=2026352 RepID=UPI0035CB006E